MAVNTKRVKKLPPNKSYDPTVDEAKLVKFVRR